MLRPRKSLRFRASGLRLAAGLVCGACLAGPPAFGAAPTLSAVVDLAGVAAPRAADLELRVDGRPAEVVAVERLAPAPEGEPWQVLVYFDTPLLSPAGLEAAIRRLSDSAERLVALGPVTLVVADPEPRELATAVGYAHEIRESLALLGDRTTLAGELLWRRLRFVDAVRGSELDEARRRREMERERGLIDRQRRALLGALEGRPGGGAKLLILVQDGFDLDFKRFYLGRTEGLEGLDTDVDEAHADLCRRAAVAGWTVVGLALGEQGSEFVDPRRPLRLLTEETGGVLVRRGRLLREVLAGLGGRVRVDYRTAQTPGESAELEVSYRARPIVAPRWAGRQSAPRAAEATPPAVAAEAPSAVRLLLPGSGPHVGPTRVTAVTGEHEVGYVAFFLDGFLVDVVHHPPFQARIDLGAAPQLHTVRAAAFSPAALELGEDTLRLNQEERPFRVDIVEVVGDPGQGEVELRAAISTPADRRLERVEVFWNDELRSSFASPPSPEIRARVDTEPPGPTDHYRVVAHLDDGARLESARLVVEPGISDRLDVNLVELYAMVSDRAESSLEHLSREDFTLFHGGRTRPIEAFARADDVPLTLGLAVDTSESMKGWQDELRDAAAAFFESALGEHDRAFLTDFDERPRVTQGPTRRQELLVGRMGALDFGGTTALYDAILFSLTQFEGQGGRKALVVLSDGEDYGSRFRPERCIREAQRLGVPIYVVVVENPESILDSIDRMIAERLARQSGGRAFFFGSKAELRRIYAAIVADLSNQYLLAYAMARPLTAADLGDIRVEVSDPKLSVRTVLGRSVRAN